MLFGGRTKLVSSYEGPNDSLIMPIDELQEVQEVKDKLSYSIDNSLLHSPHTLEKS